MTEQKVNMNIVEGDAFFAHETSMNFNPTQFILDFKCVTPRMDQRSGHNIHLEHNVVMVEAFHAKRLHELLGDQIRRYEKQFGKINEPKQYKKVPRPKKESKGSIPNYLG